MYSYYNTTSGQLSQIKKKRYLEKIFSKYSQYYCQVINNPTDHKSHHFNIKIVRSIHSPCSASIKINITYIKRRYLYARKQRRGRVNQDG